MNYYIAYIRGAAQTYSAFKSWTTGDPRIRGWEMHRCMRDIVMTGVLYRIERLKVNS